MPKRFLLTLLLLAALISTLFTFPASAETLSGTCGAEGDNLTWTLDTSSHTLTISGTGAMEDYSLSVKSSPWTGNVIRTVIIEPGVTSIGKTAFYCISDIRTLTIPDGLETIGSLAFYYCDKLESIVLPQSLQSIGDKAFFSCTALLTVYNCSSLPLVKGSADHGCVAAFATTLDQHYAPEAAACQADRTCLLCGTVFPPSAAHLLIAVEAVKPSFFTKGASEGFQCLTCDGVFLVHEEPSYLTLVGIIAGTILISTGLSLLFMLLIHRRKGKKHSNHKGDLGGESKTPL